MLPPFGAWPSTPAKTNQGSFSGSADSAARAAENSEASDPVTPAVTTTTASTTQSIGDSARQEFSFLLNGAGQPLIEDSSAAAVNQINDPPDQPPVDLYAVERRSLGVLNANWDNIRGWDQIVSLNDLKKITSDPDTPAALRNAAGYFVHNPYAFEELDTANSATDNNKFSAWNISQRLAALGPAPGSFQQVSTHNSYEKPHDLQEQFDEFGIRSFELDIRSDVSGSGDELPDGVWDVRHDSNGESTGSFDGQLDIIAGFDTDDPITLFIDLKGDALSGDNHSPSDLDELLEDKFGNRLFTPADLMARAPEARTLQEAVQIAGWPTEAELSGKVIVGLTHFPGGALGDYYEADRDDGVSMGAFLAPKIGTGQFNPDDNAVIYNIKATQRAGFDDFDNVAQTNLEVIASGNWVRNFDVRAADSFDTIAASGATFVGTDDYTEVSLE